MIVALIAALLIQSGQDPSAARFIHSWKKGSHTIEQKEYDIQVSRTNPSLALTIRDASGNPKYRLFVMPVMHSRDVIDSWMVKLVQKRTIRNIFDDDVNVNL